MRLKIGMLGGVAAIALLTAAIIASPAGAKTKTKTYVSGLVNVPILDDPGAGAGPLAVSPIKVGDKGDIKNVKVGVRISHTRDSDLQLYLFRGNTYVRLSSANGGAGNGYGAGTADCSGQQTVFDGGAPSFIQFASAPFAGSFKPEESLGVFNRRSSKGTWQLVAFDTQPNQTGTINCWSINIERKV